jgi:hypothetical protein
MSTGTASNSESRKNVQLIKSPQVNNFFDGNVKNYCPELPRISPTVLRTSPPKFELERAGSEPNYPQLLSHIPLYHDFHYPSYLRPQKTLASNLQLRGHVFFPR